LHSIYIGVLLQVVLFNFLDVWILIHLHLLILLLKQELLLLHLLLI